MKKNKAKAVATLALAGALLTTPFAAQAANFKDIGANHWAYSYISKLSDLRIIKGYDDGTFKPLRHVSYLEILELLKGIQNPTSTEMTSAMATYSYIADAYKVPNWAKPAVCIALQNNVITESNLKAAYNLNYINNVRNANQFPSRELALVYYAKALGIQPKKDTSNIKVTDVDSIGKTPKELIGNVDVKGILASMIDAGIFNAFGTGAEFKGSTPLQRDQMAKITDTSYEYKSFKSFEGEVLGTVEINNVPALSIKDADGKNVSFVLSKDTVVTINGKSAKAEDLTAGSKVKVKAFPQSGGIAPYQAVSVDVISTELSGVGIIDDFKNNEIQISYSTKKDVAIDESFKVEKTASFKLDKNPTITSFGKKFDLKYLSSKDMVVFKAQDGVLKELVVYPYNGTVNGEFVNYEYNRFGTSRIVLKLEDKKEYEFYVNDTKVAEQLYNLTKTVNKGYPLALTTRYRKIIDATEMESTVEGYYQGFSTGTSGYEITIRNEDGTKSYPVAEGVYLILGNNGKVAIKDQKDLFTELDKFKNAKQVPSKLTLKGGKVIGVQIIGVLEKADNYAKLDKVVPVEDKTGSFGYNTLPGYKAFDITFTINGKTETRRLLVAEKDVPAIENSGNSLALKYDSYYSLNKSDDKPYGNLRLETRDNKNIPLYAMNASAM